MLPWQENTRRRGMYSRVEIAMERYEDASMWLAKGFLPRHARRLSKGRPRRQVQYGDVVYVLDGGAKRFGIWTGEGFVQYGLDASGANCVHEASLHEFLHGAGKLSVCRFPRQYWQPDEFHVPMCAVVMPPDRYLLHLMERQYRKAAYHRYPPEQTIRRARECLGRTNFASSEAFALWCKTGMNEFSGLRSMQKILRRILTY